ncbi:MAG: GH39 family glycosyl hydrolase [Candidatus Acidiferrales bacterium]
MSLLLAAALLGGLQAARAQNAAPMIEINASAPGQPFPHSWERMFGSGRAILSLRDSYRSDLRTVQAATGFEYVRFHGILNDEVGVYSETPDGKPAYNFSYVDQIYDGLLEAHVRPFVELSFMPAALAEKPIFQSFWYKPNVSPPKSWEKWDDLIEHLANHLIQRYGIAEVSQWYFEVWNEPNLDFWAGSPKEETYYRLYDETARTLKSVDPRLRVGGPATAQAAWVDRFIKHCVENNVPVDFVSSHVYANDTAENIFGDYRQVTRANMVCLAVRKVHDEIQASTRPDLPLIWSEYNASYMNETEITDSNYMGPWLADTIRQCDGLADILSFWTFSDVFEEQGVVKKPFYGGYGLIAEDGLPKPSFNAFQLLHRLGTRRLEIQSESALATRREDGTLAIAVWNQVPPGEQGLPKPERISFTGLSERPHAVISYLDAAHGSLWDAYRKMGEPAYPTREQIDELRRAAALPPPEEIPIRKGEIDFVVPPQGLALVEVQ